MGKGANKEPKGAGDFGFNVTALLAIATFTVVTLPALMDGAQTEAVLIRGMLAAGAVGVVTWLAISVAGSILAGAEAAARMVVAKGGNLDVTLPESRPEEEDEPE